MINHQVPINFLRHVYSESVSDLANIIVAEAEDDYDTIIKYLSNLRKIIGNWIEELETKKDKK
jgi:hypothetical protein